jgi:hypothetical protein
LKQIAFANMPKNNTYILTVAVGYSDEVKAEFRRGLFATGYTGQLGILSWTRGGGQFFTERLNAYHETIAKIVAGETQYDTIITTDLRDVLFQGNPENIQHSELDVYMEDTRMRISDCPYNSQWIRSGWGEAGLAKVGHNTISCAGVIIGTPAGMLSYYKQMTDLTNAGYAHVCDQGIHNWLLHTGQLKARMVANEYGEVYTLQYVDGITVRNHRIYNKSGRCPIICHQYDRHLEKL